MRILVAMDGTKVGETALAAVAPWARAAKADVHLFTVLRPESIHETAQTRMVATGSGPIGAVATPQRKTIEDRTQAMARALNQARDHLSLMASRYLPGVPHSTNVIWAEDPATEICRCAETLHAGLIAVGTHGRRGMSRALLGSVAEEVVRKATSPVVVVPHGTIELSKEKETVGARLRPRHGALGKERLLAYLSHNAAPFMLDHHPPAYSAQQMAGFERLPDHIVAKVVLTFADDNLAMFVVPGDMQLDRRKARRLLGAHAIRLATEDEMALHIPDCEVGAAHPFGNLYRVPVYTDNQVVDQRSLAFFAGLHTDTVYMESADFVRLAQPITGDIASSFRRNARQSNRES